MEEKVARTQKTPQRVYLAHMWRQWHSLNTENGQHTQQGRAFLTVQETKCKKKVQSRHFGMAVGEGYKSTPKVLLEEQV